MTTPLDGALRVQQREVEAFRVTIAFEVERATMASAASAAARATVDQERSIAAESPLLPTQSYLKRMKATQKELAAAAADADARLERLQERAVEAYGKARVIELAVEQHRKEANRVIAAAEQRDLDDLAGRQSSGDWLTSRS
jgi:flagellar biosynthesis chaperone FliJ